MATKQELQLGTLNFEYSRFVKDQVLTEVQLNEIIDFFEDQHRITRTCMIGTGIVCGLHLRRNPKSISISEGVAVTTDGDLIKMSATNFKYFAAYIQPDNGKYDPFYYKQGTEEKPVKLFQLLTDDEKDKITSAEVFTVGELDSKITNWVGMLYLEYYLKDPEKCTPTNCDNLGRRQVAKPMVLLISNSDMEKVVHLDTGEVIGDDIYLKYYEAYEKYFTFPVIRPKRILLNNINTLQSTALAGAYFTASKDGSSALSNAILDLYNAFRFLIDRDNSINITNLVNKLNTNLNSASNTLYAQYTYDFYKDIVTAYNELRDMLYSVAFECIPNLYAFPKHIMLGGPDINYGPLPAKFRHQFYPSPAVSRHKNEVNVAIGMLDRLEQMVLNFSPVEVDAIKITPSRDYDKLLEDRAIPFYFQNFTRLSQVWNYRKALKANDKLNLSYNANLYQPPVNDETLNPLDYSIDEYNFFRIEGHIGKDYKTALNKLDELKNQKGVPIDIVAVRLGDTKLSDINLDDFECQFEDLKTILHAFQVEINCVLGDGSSFFSGFTAKPLKPHTNILRYIAPEGQSPWIINEALLKVASKSAILDAAAKAAGTGNVKEKISGNVGATFTATAPVVDICDRFLNPVFEINRAVKIKIDDHPDAFGKYYQKAMETENISVDEFTEKARSFAAADPELNSLNEDERYVVFEYPTQIIAHLNVMQRFVPGTINEITQIFITDYRNFSQSFCNRIKIMRTRLEKYFRTGNYSSRGFESEYMNMIDRLEKLCCGNEKLEVVMREIERRKALILQNLSLAKYAEQHPGMEHKAGSLRGGTFVIVYASAPKISTTQSAFTNLSADKKLEKERAASKANAVLESQYKDIDSFALHIVSNDETINREEELGLFFTKNKIERGSAYSEFVIKELNTKITAISKIICRNLSQPVADIVIADFCLPYLCCSKCPPVAFIIQKPQEPEAPTIKIDKNSFCSIDPASFPITVTPKGGVVSGSGVSVQDDGNYIFKPANAGTGLQTLTYTVNGKTASVQVEVILTPVAKFSSVITVDNAIALLTLTNETTGRTAQTSYEWFRDGQSFSKDENPGPIEFRTTNPVKSITLTVSNGACPDESTQDIVIPAEEPTIEIEKDSYCNNDQAVYPIVVTPAGGTLSGDGSSKNADGNTVFVPASVETPGKVVITYTANGKSVTKTVEVFETPVAQFSAVSSVQDGVMFVTLKNESTGISDKTKFEWLLDGNTFSENRDTEPVSFKLETLPHTILLRESNGQCPSEFSKVINLEIENRSTSLCSNLKKFALEPNMTPTDSVQILSNDGIKMNEPKLEVLPASTGVQQTADFHVSYIINGKQVNVTITVIVIDAGFLMKLSHNTSPIAVFPTFLTLTAKETTADKYNWNLTVSDGRVLNFTEKEVVFNYHQNDVFPGSLITISLIVRKTDQSGNACENTARFALNDSIFNKHMNKDAFDNLTTG